MPTEVIGIAFYKSYLKEIYLKLLLQQAFILKN